MMIIIFSEKQLTFDQAKMSMIVKKNYGVSFDH